MMNEREKLLARLRERGVTELHTFEHGKGPYPFAVIVEINKVLDALDNGNYDLIEEFED